MKIAINPINSIKINQYNKLQHNPSFKSEKKVYSEDEYYRHADKIGSFSLLLGLAMGVFIGIEAVNKPKAGDKEFPDRVQKLIKSEEVLKDTFALSDVNNNRSLDLILLKTDGSTVAVDMKNKKIIEQ